MVKQIFVNLPVRDLKKSIDFFTNLGFTFNPQFTDEKATCMIVGENIYVMLLTEKYFKSFTKKEIGDTKNNTSVIIALDMENREKVDEILEKALKSGATKDRDALDYGWMYNQSFSDLDGHQWEVFYMDMAAMPK